MAELEKVLRAIRSVRPPAAERTGEIVGPEERRRVLEGIVGWSGPVPIRRERPRSGAGPAGARPSGAGEDSEEMDRSEEVTVVEPLPSPGLPEPVEEARRRRPRRVAAVASGTAAALVVGVLGMVALRDDGAGEDPGTVAVVTLTPADVAELRAAFEEMTRHMFDGSADLGDSGLSVVADGERLRAFVEPILTSNASIYEDMGAEVVDVWGEGVDRAGVSFRVLLNGEPYTFPLGPDPSGPKELTLEAVKVDGAWKYTLESVCEMLATFGFPCPPEVRDPSYQDVTAAAEGQEVAALLERFLASGASIEEQVALVEDGERLRESIAAVSGAIEGYEVGTRVDRVLVSPGRPRAAVRFSLALDGVPVLRVTGDVVRGPQGWLLGHRTACEVVGSTWAIGVVAVDCTPGPGTSWADEPAPDLAAPDLSTDPVEPQVESAVRAVVAELIDGVAEPADLALVYPTHPATNEPLDDETVMAAIEALAAATAEVPVEVGAVGSQGVVRDPSDWSVTQPALYVGVELLGGSAPTRLSLWRSPGSSWRAYLWEVCATTEILGGEWACPEVEPAVVSPTSGPSR